MATTFALNQNHAFDYTMPAYISVSFIGYFIWKSNKLHGLWMKTTTVKKMTHTHNSCTPTQCTRVHTYTICLPITNIGFKLTKTTLKHKLFSFFRAICSCVCLFILLLIWLCDSKLLTGWRRVFGGKRKQFIITF